MEIRQGILESLAMKDIGCFQGVFKGKTVLVTGHTGFKGAWLSLWLHELGAKVVGYALRPDTEPNLFSQLGLSELMESRIGDVRDLEHLKRVLHETQPEIVFHLAAQSLVRRSCRDPIATYSTNVLGAANLLETVRQTDSVRVCQIITSDKCYENREWVYAYRENDPVGGRDPYSASKACAELVVSSYRSSFFPIDKIDCHGVSLSSARAGNVIGGGDWAEDRIMPDCIRALSKSQSILVRNPSAVRPWQHVLEPLSGYLHLCSLQLSDPARYAQAWNFGPTIGESVVVSELVDLIVRFWGAGDWFAPLSGNGAGDESHEAMTLKLDCSKAHELLKWRPVYNLEDCISQAVGWYREALGNKRFDALSCTRKQIHAYVLKARERGLPWAYPLAPLAKQDAISGLIHT